MSTGLTDNERAMLETVMAKNPAPKRDTPTTNSTDVTEARLAALEAKRPPPPTPEQLAAKQERALRERREQYEWTIKERQLKLTADMGQRYSQARASLDTFKPYHAAQSPIMEKVQGIALDLQKFVADGRGLILYGPVGTGKDHLLAGLLYEAIAQNITVRWINGLDFYGSIRDRMSDEKPEKALIEELVTPGVLAISDPIPPNRGPTDWNIEVLLRLVDRRYRQCKSTWLTMNVVDAKEADELLSSQVFDRLRHGAELLHCEWPSYRGLEKKAG